MKFPIRKISIDEINKFIEKHPEIEDKESMEFLLKCEDSEMKVKKKEKTSELFLGRQKVELDEIDETKLIDHNLLPTPYTYLSTQQKNKV